MIRTLLVLVLCSIASGCATGRIADLKDCGRFSVGVGLGLTADVKLGDISHPSVGFMSYTHRLGHENRDISGVWTETEGAFPLTEIGNIMGPGKLLFMSYGADLVEKGHAGALEKFHRVGFWLPWERTKLTRNELGMSPFNTASDIQVGLTLGIVSARAGINPLEIVDFVLGFFGFDIAGDDERKTPTTGRAVPPESGVSGVL